MTNEIITTLHPDQDPDTNLYPNIKKENIPNKSISLNKLDDNVISFMGSLKPSGVNTSSNILSKTSDDGIWIGSDTGKWYYWDGSQYVEGGVYQAVIIEDNSITPDKTTFSRLVKNLYDYTKQKTNFLWNSNLELQSYNSYYAYGEAITLEPNSKYYLINCPNISNSFSFITDGTTQTTLNTSPYWDYNEKTITTGDSTLYLYLTFNRNTNLDTPTDPFYKENLSISKYKDNYLKYGIDFINIDNLVNDKHIYYVGSKRSIKKIKDGIEQATQFLNSVVYVDDGTYDLVSEYGLDYLNSFTQDNYEIGLVLKNNVKVIFSSNSKVTFNYTGSNYYVNTLFSPFNFSYEGGGGSLIGANIDCSNCRYCIHDDQSNSLITTPYHNQIIKCTLDIDNSQNSNWQYQEITIGGGIGYNGLIEIKECILEKYAYYHQNAGNISGSRSDIYFTNNYSNSNFRLTSNPNWRNITDVSRLIAFNNSTLEAIEIVDTGELHNVKLYSVNNEVRS